MVQRVVEAKTEALGVGVKAGKRPRDIARGKRGCNKCANVGVGENNVHGDCLLAGKGGDERPKRLNVMRGVVVCQTEDKTCQQAGVDEKSRA